MKQFKIIPMLAFLFVAFSISEIAAQQNWRLSLTTDFHVPFNNKGIDYWKEVFGDEYGSLISRKKQKSSVSLLAGYHFFNQKPVGFFVGTGIGYKKYENFERSHSSGENAYIFSLSNITVPWSLGLDLRPNDRLTINLSATYEHMFPTWGFGGWAGTRVPHSSLNNDEHVMGEFTDNVSGIGYSIQNQGGVVASIDLGFDIEIYKNYRLFIGTGIGTSFNRYETINSVRYFSPSTGEPHASSTHSSSIPGSNRYRFINLETGITKTF